MLNPGAIEIDVVQFEQLARRGTSEALESGIALYRGPLLDGFRVAAPGFETLVTHVFVAGSPYLDSDAVFAVKQRLIRDFAQVDDPEKAAAHEVEAPFRHAHFDVVLQPTPDPGRG